MTGKAKKLVLLSLSSQYVHSALAPWCLVNGLKQYAKSDYEAVVTEGTVNEPVLDILARVVAQAPDVLGISCYIWNIKTVAALLPMVREALPNCVIVLGGPEVGFRALDALRSFKEADYILSGEGELPFAKLVDALSGIGALDLVPGLSYRAENGVHISEPYLHEDTQGSPYSEEYFKALNGRIAYLETSRGCPFSCAFCLSGRREGLRCAPMKQAFADILSLAKSGSRTIKLVDRTFNADRRRALEIMRFIALEYGKGIPDGVTFHFEIAGDLLDEGTLNFMKTAPVGLFQFEIGLQSMDETTLKTVRRQTDMVYLQKQVNRLIQMGTAHVHLDLIAGLPGEGLAEFRKGFNAAYLLRPQALQLGFLKLIHGSAMREEPENYPCEYDQEPPYQVISTPFMSAQDFTELQTVERALDKAHNAGRFPRIMHFLTGEIAMEPYALFLMLGQRILALEEEIKGSLSLDSLNDCLFEALCGLLPAQKERIRDLMVMDRLSSTKTAVLPQSLKRPDKRMNPLKQKLNKLHPVIPGGLRVCALLYQGVEQLVWCDYEEQDKVSGLYTLHTKNVQDSI